MRLEDGPGPTFLAASLAVFGVVFWLAGPAAEPVGDGLIKTGRLVSGKQLAAVPRPKVERPDRRDALRPTSVTAAELGTPQVLALGFDEQEALIAALNSTTGACDSCQQDGLSLAACALNPPSGCEIAAPLVSRAARLAAAGQDATQVQASIQYADSWLVVPEAHLVGSGPTDAPVRLVVAVDYESPFSSQAVGVVTALQKDYPQQLRVELLHAPREKWPSVQLARRVLAVDGEARAWEDHKALLVQPELREQALVEAGPAPADPELVVGPGDDAVGKRLAEELAVAASLGVRGTPTVFVNGHRVRGLRAIDEYKRLIELELSDVQGETR